MNASDCRVPRGLLRSCSAYLLASTRTASALPLAYDEAISGDLAYPYQTLNLDAGLNTIRGTCTYDLTHRFDDFDHFLFVVPEGMELTTFSFSSVPSSTAIAGRA